MDINFTKEFLRSKFHLVVALSTLGLGFMWGNVVALILGAIAYGLSVMFIPEMPWFKNKINNQHQEIENKKAEDEKNALVEKRYAQLKTLHGDRLSRYRILAGTCAKIEENVDNSTQEYDSVFRKLEELLATYLKLLLIEQSLEVFLESETKENIDSDLKESRGDLESIEKEVQVLRAKSPSSAQLDLKLKLLNSKKDKVAILSQRKDKTEQAKSNAEVVSSELDRLEQQIKLIRSDSIATRNSSALTSKIDASIEQINQTNKWLGEVQDFKEVMGDDQVAPSQRIGFLKGEPESTNDSCQRKMKTRGLA